MGILKIRGGKRLRGEVRVQGSKNGALPLLAAALLAGGECEIANCPRLSDIDAAMEILGELGCAALRQEDRVLVDGRGLDGCEIPDRLMGKMRSSVIFLGPLLARTGEARLTVPGGCELGPRPVDLHLSAMEALGARVERRGGRITVRGERLRGGKIYLRFPSVGATENAMLAAAGARGKTQIINAAREPEIMELQEFLRAMGCRVSGAGGHVITLEGGRSLHPCRHRVWGDRIAAATALAAVTSTGGELRLTGLKPQHLGAVLRVLSQMGVSLRTERDAVTLRAGALKAPPPVLTEPYPGFPTDAQPPLMAAALRAEGNSVFVENIFESRFHHAEELRRMGADIRVQGRVALLRGGKPLIGTEMRAHDLRGGAALAVAALAAEGESRIHNAELIDRGYEDLAASLRALGAEAERTEEE